MDEVSRLTQAAARSGLAHDRQLLRDLAIINERTQRELGPLPPGGLPVEPKRKPTRPTAMAPMPVLGSREDEENDMNLSQIAATAVLAAAGATACNPSTLLGGKTVPDYKQNPNPKQRYDITMVIANAPGPFESMEGLAQYDVVTPECLPKSDFFSGMPAPTPTDDIPFTLTRVSKTEYTGTVYADLMLDEDYHGRGVCHWRLIQARVHMKATGVEGETVFIPNLSAEPLFAEQTKTIYFLKESYPSDPTTLLENYVEFGQADRSKMAPSLKESDLFTITLTSKRMTP
jgi:hypothetical protein